MGNEDFKAFSSAGTGNHKDDVSLRDYFAAQVLTTLHIDGTNIHGSARFAYEVADAMLEARKI